MILNRQKISLIKKQAPKCFTDNIKGTSVKPDEHITEVPENHLLLVASLCLQSKRKIERSKGYKT